MTSIYLSRTRDLTLDVDQFQELVLRQWPEAVFPEGRESVICTSTARIERDSEPMFQIILLRNDTITTDGDAEQDEEVAAWFVTLCRDATKVTEAGEIINL